MAKDLEKLLEIRKAIWVDCERFGHYLAPYKGSTEEWFRKLEIVIETKLDDKEKKVFTESFGLNAEKKSAKEIAGELNLSTSRIYQIKEKAIRKLRANSKKYE